jgi:hypothetical protein
MTFQAEPPEVAAALQEAARRTGFQFLSGDVSTGTTVFTSGRLLLGVGEKVIARMKQIAPGTVEVTVSSDPKLGGLVQAGHGPGADRLAEALSGLLPHTA